MITLHFNHLYFSEIRYYRSFFFNMICRNSFRAKLENLHVTTQRHTPENFHPHKDRRERLKIRFLRFFYKVKYFCKLC